MRVYLVAQMVENPPVVQETRVQSLGREDPLEKGMATHFSILTWRIMAVVTGASWVMPVVTGVSANELESVKKESIFLNSQIGRAHV